MAAYYCYWRVAIFAFVGLFSVSAVAEDTPVRAPVSASVRSEDGVYNLIFNQELRYVTWEGTRGYPRNPFITSAGSGSQFHMPMALKLTAVPSREWNFEFLARTAYVDSRQSSPDQRGSYAGMIDTVMSGRVTYLGNPLFAPFFSLMTNLPTGETRLAGNARFARMDPDIVDVATFGEGFNIGPTVGVSVPVHGNTLFTFALGQTFRGQYTRDDPATATATRFVSPSDQTSFVATVNSRIDRFGIRAGLVYSSFTTATVQNPFAVVTVKPGDRVTLSAGATYYWQDLPMTTSADIWWTHQQRNDITRNPLPAPFSIPPFNSNTDVTRVSIQQDYHRDRWNVAGRLSYMHRNHNEFAPEFVGFIPPKTKWELAALAGYRVSEAVRFAARIARIWTKEDATPDVGIPGCCFSIFDDTAIPAIRQNAWVFSLGGLVVF